MENIEVIRLTLDHMSEQYLSFYFSILHEVCNEKHEHTQQLGDTFSFVTEEYEMYDIIYRISLDHT